jgi:hypothetical protein
VPGSAALCRSRGAPGGLATLACPASWRTGRAWAARRRAWVRCWRRQRGASTAATAASASSSAPARIPVWAPSPAVPSATTTAPGAPRMAAPAPPSLDLRRTTTTGASRDASAHRSPAVPVRHVSGQLPARQTRAPSGSGTGRNTPRGHETPRGGRPGAPRRRRRRGGRYSPARVGAGHVREAADGLAPSSGSARAAALLLAEALPPPDPLRECCAAGLPGGCPAGLPGGCVAAALPGLPGGCPGAAWWLPCRGCPAAGPLAAWRLARWLRGGCPAGCVAAAPLVAWWLARRLPGGGLHWLRRPALPRARRPDEQQRRVVLKRRADVAQQVGAQLVQQVGR